MSAIARLLVVIIAAAVICACRHSEPAPSTSTTNSAVGRWQAEIPSTTGQRQACTMEVVDTGQIAYSDSCPMPLTGQRATLVTMPNGGYAPNLYTAGKDSGTFMIVGGSISGMEGAFRIEGSTHLITRTAPGADIEWTRVSTTSSSSTSSTSSSSSGAPPMRSAAAGQVLGGQIQWPMGDVPGFAQRALAYVRSKWQRDAFLTSINMEQTTGFTNVQSPAGGVLIQLNFYSPEQQQILTYMPNSAAGELTPGSSADPNDERALPMSFVDLPEAMAKLRAKGLRGHKIKTAHLENYGRGSYAGSTGVFGTEWVIDSNLDERGVVLAEMPDQNDARLSNPNEGDEEEQTESDVHVEVAGLRNNRGQVYCHLFRSAGNFPTNSDGNAASTASTITNRSASCDFENLDPGTYAILVFHDEDSTHELELTSTGAPREGVGLSNNPPIASSMPSYDAAMFTYRAGKRNLTINVKYPAGQPTENRPSFGGSADANARLVGFAFVDNSVTAMGSRGKLPPGAKIYPPGSTIAGTDGCPTNRYNTDGMIVAVIDYQGRPTAASLGVTRHPARGGQFENAPYYLDLNSGRTLQFLGPILENGSYDILFKYDFSLGAGKTLTASFALSRNCPRAP